MKTERGASRGRRRCAVQWQHKGGIEMNVVGMRGPDSGTMTTRLAGVLLRVELVVVAGTFFVFALLHLGIRLAGIAEPRILPATIVEAVCGLCMALAAAATFAGTPRAWRAAVTAHAISFGGVLLGILAQARGTGGTELSAVYHRTVLVILVAGLALLLTRRGRVALRKSPLNPISIMVKSHWSGKHDRPA